MAAVFSVRFEVAAIHRFQQIARGALDICIDRSRREEVVDRRSPGAEHHALMARR